MKNNNASARFKETELKLALPSRDPNGLRARLAKTSTLAKRVSTHLNLHNIYYDSPTQLLREARIALRLRRVDGDRSGEGHWLQTLKIGGQSDSALSQRGEWEVPVAGPKLSLKALQDTPWAEFDPHGDVFKALVPCFTTRFERTRWLLRQRDGTQIEVALDLGDIVAGDKTAPICELELELLAGQADALFGVACALSRFLAVLPLNASKSERGYALAQDDPVLATNARPPPLHAEMDIIEAAQRVLREMFSQFTGNLYRLLRSSEPEAVHQARIGWRRFKSSLRLFKPVMKSQARPSWQGLQSVLACLGTLRNIDVARLNTLPPLATLYIAGDAQRASHWTRMNESLERAAHVQLAALRAALQAPAAGACLLSLAQWLENLSFAKQADRTVLQLTESLSSFAKRRTGQLHHQLHAICQLDGAENAHQVRLLAKRLRYNVESLSALLPKKIRRAEREQALQLQEQIGAQRDLAQAVHLLTELAVAPELLAFMRGYAMGNSDAPWAGN